MNFKDIKFSNYVDPDEMAKVEKWLEDNKPLFWRYTNGHIVPNSVVANYCIGVDGADPIKLLNQICHNSMDSFSQFNKKRNSVGTSIALNNNAYGVSKELMMPFFDYFCNRSFASPMIAKVTEDWVIYSADNPSVLLQNALIMSRHFREISPLAFESFNKYTAEGYSEEFCYHYFFNSSISMPSHVLASPMTNKSTHRAFNFPRSTSVLKRLLHRDYGEFDMRHYRNIAIKYGGSVLGGNPLEMNPVLLSEVLKKDEGKSIVFNPFTKQAKASYTIQQAIDALPVFKEKGLTYGYDA